MAKKKTKSKAEYIGEAVQLGLNVDTNLSISALKKLIAKERKESGHGDGSEALPSPKRELFCYLFSGHNNKVLFGNATKCYLEAYGINEEIGELQEKIEAVQTGKKKGFTTAVDILKGKKKTLYNSANASASRLLVNVNIRKRCRFLMDQMIGDDLDVDSELKFLILQRQDFMSKLGAIKEYNSVKERTSNKLEGDFVMRWDDADMKPQKSKKK